MLPILFFDIGQPKLRRKHNRYLASEWAYGFAVKGKSKGFTIRLWIKAGSRKVGKVKIPMCIGKTAC
tara:strand:+ start:914 stop:1114 length:201 start_codon:yes stop_codon:yes gene_type:complete